MWTFVNGSDGVNSPSNFGEPRIPDPNAFPGAREYTVCWTDNNGHFWLYGGWHLGYLADTWRFDGINWAFWGGSNVTDAAPVYGIPKTFSFDYHPGGRYISSVAVPTSGSSAYLVGGFGVVDASSDIWKFESDKGWAFWSGDIGPVNPVPGTIRVPSETNKLGSKTMTMTVVDEFDNLWIFGGLGLLTSGSNSM
jgi:hypothetical protein